MKGPMIYSAGLTDKGLVRERNEDSYSLNDELKLYVVADGMGGHHAGEVASHMAVELINKNFEVLSKSHNPQEILFGDHDNSLSQAGNFVLSSIKLANRVIYEMAEERPEYSGMGTTVAAVALLPGLVVCANAGDSRIYLVRNQDLEKLSEDHTIVSQNVTMGVMTKDEAETSPLKHILSKNLGSALDVDPEIFELEPEDKDRFLICTDGLTDLISDEELYEMIMDEDDPEILCRNCIDMSLQRGGHDNITVAVVYLAAGYKKRAGRVKKWIGSYQSSMP